MTFANAAEMEEDNRVREYLSDLNNRTNDPEEMMMEIMEVLNDTVTLRGADASVTLPIGIL